ncbi:HTH-type transcriptional regulator YesS [compost metagenome]
MHTIVGGGVITEEYQVYMIRLISESYNILLEEDVSISQVLSPQATVEYFIRLNSYEDIILWFSEELFKPITEFMLVKQERLYISDIGQSMLDIIHQRYHEDLTLDICGAELHFHPVHLSRVFKKELGVGFMEYLVDYRMKIAKHKLEQTNVKISTLAEELSYSNTSSFIRVFRRVVGVTPGQYRIRERR